MKKLVLVFSPTIFLESLADLLVNISAGWFAALLIVPAFISPILSLENFLFLIKNLFFGIVFFVAAYLLQIWNR